MTSISTTTQPNNDVELLSMAINDNLSMTSIVSGEIQGVEYFMIVKAREDVIH